MRALFRILVVAVVGFLAFHWGADTYPWVVTTFILVKTLHRLSS